MTAATMSTKGQLVLPKEIRDQLKLEAGDKIDFQIEAEDRVILRPVKKSLSALEGFLPKPAKPVSLAEMDETIAESGLGE